MIKHQIISAPPQRERGRENGSFPVAEILKPQGFKNVCLNKHLAAEQ
jgi:hypothetical protein